MKKNILVFCIRLSSFIQRDIDILKYYYNVRIIEFNIKEPKQFLSNFNYFLKSLFWANIYYSWFANYHSFFSAVVGKLLRKKTIIIVGGYDIEYVPEINYGLMNKKSPIYYLVKTTLFLSDIILPFSHYAYSKVLKIDPIFKNKMYPLFLSCDFEKYVPKNKKKNIVLTVCVIKRDNIKRKGLLTYINCAELLPEINFYIVGKFLDDSIYRLRKNAPKNLIFTGFISEKQLIQLYQEAKVYAQLSYQEGEGGGGALGEAMACECIPIVTNEAVSLKETVGDCGYYVSYNDVENINQIIKVALNDEVTGKKARIRMINLFSRKNRQKDLYNVIENNYK